MFIDNIFSEQNLWKLNFTQKIRKYTETKKWDPKVCTSFIVFYSELTNLHFKSTVHGNISSVPRLVNHRLFQQC